MCSYRGVWICIFMSICVCLYPWIGVCMHVTPPKSIKYKWLSANAHAYPCMCKPKRKCMNLLVYVYVYTCVGFKDMSDPSPSRERIRRRFRPAASAPLALDRRGRTYLRKEFRTDSDHVLQHSGGDEENTRSHKQRRQRPSDDAEISIITYSVGITVFISRRRSVR